MLAPPELTEVKLEADGEVTSAANAAAAEETGEEAPGLPPDIQRLTAEIAATEASVKELTTSIGAASAKLEAQNEARLAGPSTERSNEAPFEEKLLHTRRMLHQVEEELSGGTAEALGEALRRVDEFEFAGLMRDLRAEQRRRACKEQAGKRLAEAQALLQEAVASEDAAAVLHASDGLEEAIAACESADVDDDLEAQRKMLTGARDGVRLRRDLARRRLDAAAGEEPGEEGRRQRLQEALDEAERAGLQESELRVARRSLEQDEAASEALAELRRLASYHREHKADDDASKAEFCSALKRAASCKLTKAVQDATPVYRLLAERSWARGRRMAASKANAAAALAKAAAPVGAAVAARAPAKAHAAAPPAVAAATSKAAAPAKAVAPAKAAGRPLGARAPAAAVPTPARSPGCPGAAGALGERRRPSQADGLRAKAASLAAGAAAARPAAGAAGGRQPSPQRPFSAFGRKLRSVLPLRRRAPDRTFLDAAQPKKRPQPGTPPWRATEEAADGAGPPAKAARRAAAGAPPRRAPWRPAAEAPRGPPATGGGAAPQQREGRRPWRPAEEAVGAGGGGPLPPFNDARAPRTPRRQRSGQGGSEDSIAGLPDGVPAGSIFWKNIKGMRALVINSDTFPKTLMEMGMNAGKSALDEFNWKMWDDWMDHWVECSETAGAGYMYWDAHVDGCSARACAYGQPQKQRTMRALGIALAVACAVHCGKPRRYGDSAFPCRQWEQLVKAAADMGVEE